jgi:integrase
LEAASAVTFRECAEAILEAKRHEWKNAKHASQWQNTLKTYAYPVLGDLPVQHIETSHVLKALQPIWTKKPETASRVRQRIENILSWATARDYRSGENPARWRGHLDKLLASPAKIKTIRHHPALPWSEVSQFMGELSQREGNAARALEFTILVAARTGEVIGAKWDEVDLSGGVWTIPAERTKARREHRVPLSKAAKSLLRDLPQVEGQAYVFKGHRYDKPLSNMAMATVLKRMGRDDLTVHGFRSTFRDWCAEATNYPRELAEAALAHVLKDKTEAAYQRGDMFARRARLMQAWSDYCAKPLMKCGDEY